MKTAKLIFLAFGILVLYGCGLYRFSQVPLSEYGQSPQGFYVYDGINNGKPSDEILNQVDELFGEFDSCVVPANREILDELKQTVIIIAKHSDMYRGDLHGFYPISSKTIIVDDIRWLKHEWLHNYFSLAWKWRGNLNHKDPLFTKWCMSPF